MGHASCDSMALLPVKFVFRPMANQTVPMRWFCSTLYRKEHSVVRCTDSWPFCDSFVSINSALIIDSGLMHNELITCVGRTKPAVFLQV
jgi:hypothetical protein